MATEGHGSCLIALPRPATGQVGQPDANRFILPPPHPPGRRGKNPRID